MSRGKASDGLCIDLIIDSGYFAAHKLTIHFTNLANLIFNKNLESVTNTNPQERRQ